LYYGPNQETFVYRKVNLAVHERGAFVAGSKLPVLDITVQGQTVKLGIQLCREIRFPEQWQTLARAGAEIFVYLTNAVGDKTVASVWRSHLVSRAAENQRFVLCANNAHPEQKCPSMIAAPSGQVLWETLSAEPEWVRYELGLAQVSNWYLSQSREDLLK
jgi:predicted amidohydrolase